MAGKAVIPLGDLLKALNYLAMETIRPQSQSFAKQLHLHVRTYQGSDDPLKLADINNTLNEWKESNYHDEWPEKDIDNPASRSMTYVLQLAHASEDQRQCFFFNDFSKRHKEQSLPCGDHFHFQGGPQGQREFKYFVLQDPFIYTVKTWGELSNISYLLQDSEQPI